MREDPELDNLHLELGLLKTCDFSENVLDACYGCICSYLLLYEIVSVKMRVIPQHLITLVKFINLR